MAAEIWQEQDIELGKASNKSTTMTTVSAKAIVSRDTLENGGWKMEDVTIRPLKEGELLVEMAASGICHTDALVGGLPGGAAPIAFYPRVLGHEGSGYVKEVGPGVTVAQPGDPVLLSFNYCETCNICKTGHHSHCPSFTELNFGGPYNDFKSSSSSASGGSEQQQQDDIGGSFFGQSSFASFSIVSQRSVVNAKTLIRDRRELELFSPLGCGIQTGSGTVINVARAAPDDVICILGLGGVGLSAVMAAKIAGCRTIIGVDRVASRLALARDLGCTAVVDGANLPAGQTLTDAVRALADDGTGPSITIDTTGAPPLIEAGIAFTRNRGKYIQVGSPPFDYTLASIGAFDFMLSGKQFIGAIEGQAFPPDFVPRMISWYREGKFPIDKLMKFFPAADFAQGLREMHDGTTIKPILTW